MIERRRDLPLPAVQDGDPDVVEKLAEQMAGVIDTAIPAVGIEHTDDIPRTHYAVHELHSELLLGALAMLEPTILPAIEVKLGKNRNFINDQKQHTDLRWHMSPHMYNPWNPKLGLRLRLHTASPDNGAKGVFVNTTAGALVFPGDMALYDVSGKLNSDGIECGYDEALVFGHDDYGGDFQGATAPDNTTIDTTLMEPEVYTFTQSPYASVVFRTMASLGSVTGHGFVSQNPNLEHRIVYTTDLGIAAQTL